MDITELESTTLIKMILMGFSGKGKSTAIVPLSIPNLVKDFPGYKLRILDFDGKMLEVVKANLSARLDRNRANKMRLTPITQDQYKAAATNIEIEVLREKTKPTLDGGAAIIGQPQAWANTIKILERWTKDADENTIIVLDSWTHMTQTPLLAYCMALQNKSFGDFGKAQYGTDYIEPQKLARNLLTVLADMKAHVIVCAHQEPQDIKKKTGDVDDKGNPIEEVVHSEMVPISVGAKGRIAIPSQFNHILVVASDTDGNRKISTTIEDGVTTKTPFFAIADKSYSLNDGLARYWMLGR